MINSKDNKSSKILFKTTISNISVIKYYNCPKCSYSSNKTSNYSSHLKTQHPIEYFQFLQTEIKKGKTNTANKNDNNNKVFFINKVKNNTNCTSNNNAELNYFDKGNIPYLCLKEVFDTNNHLNKLDDDLGNFYLHTNKVLNSGSFGTAFLGEDKHTGFKVIIKKINNLYKDDVMNEKYFLRKIQKVGNFPPLYDVMCDDREENYFLVEGFMGFTIKSLFKICNKNFDLYTVINIGIDLISNIKKLHDNGIVHRDLKLDNITFGPLCLENYIYKSNVGIIDLGNAKLLKNKNGLLNLKDGFVHLKGNKIFSSTNALSNKDVGPIDDIESIFYILIYLLNGELPWKSKIVNQKKYTAEEIINIRNNISPFKLTCKFPLKFQILFFEISHSQFGYNPDYSKILKIFEEIKNDLKKKNMANLFEYKWLFFFKEALNKESHTLDKSKKKEIYDLFEQYSLKIDKYLDYILL